MLLNINEMTTVVGHFGNRCAKCGSHFDEYGVCVNRHIRIDVRATEFEPTTAIAVDSDILTEFHRAMLN